MTFEWPILLYGLALVPLMVGLYVLAQRRRRAYAVRFANLPLLREVAPRRPGFRRHLPPLLFLLGLAALLVSLARPSAVIAVPRDQSSVMLVLDVSGSMAARDLQPDRMAAAKQAARAFVEALPDNAQVGVVSFSSAASVNAPLGRDRDAALRAIDGLRADGGTAIGEGLDLALEQLERRPADAEGRTPPGLVVLLSDGENSVGRPPAEVAARAAQAGIPVHTVGIGQRGAAPRLNNRQSVRLDEATLQAIANATGGSYFYAGEAGELERIYADLGSQVSWVEERTEVTALASALGTLLMVVGGLFGLRWFAQLP
ncbi:MAG: VWA domain-containing protein [Chloroflexota bacterium]|nr:VWA domain-containing protein [Chloroflexota bacterium]